MDNKELIAKLHAWCKATKSSLPTSSACDTKSVTFEANGPVWWSSVGGVRCAGLTVRGYVQNWHGTIKLNIMITDDNEYFIVPKPGDYGYLRQEAFEAFKKAIPPAEHPLVAQLERWKQAIIEDLNKLEFSAVQMMQDKAEPTAFFTIRHPEIPKLQVAVDLDHDSFNMDFALGCRSHPLAKVLKDSLFRVEKQVWRKAALED